MLKDKLAQLAKNEGLNDIGIEGIELYKLSTPYPKIKAVLAPAICIIAQGSKNLHLGEQTFFYDENTYLLGTVKVPVESELIDASPEHPYLGMIIYLDASIISELLANFNDMDAWQTHKRTEEIIVSAPLDSSIVNALERLLDIANNEMDIKVLGKSILREIYYTILKTPQGYILRNSAIHHAKAHHMVSTIQYLEKNFKNDITIDEIAKVASMSVSSLHDNFKKATSLSPIQFIKQLRLHHAHALLLAGSNASNAAYESGYSNAAQFSREFKRLFGLSPRDLKLKPSDV
jgi:AraC-like DNA-binding protein